MGTDEINDPWKSKEGSPGAGLRARRDVLRAGLRARRDVLGRG